MERLLTAGGAAGSGGFQPGGGSLGSGGFRSSPSPGAFGSKGLEANLAFTGVFGGGPGGVFGEGGGLPGGVPKDVAIATAFLLGVELLDLLVLRCGDGVLSTPEVDGRGSSFTSPGRTG